MTKLTFRYFLSERGTFVNMTQLSRDMWWIIMSNARFVRDVNLEGNYSKCARSRWVGKVGNMRGGFRKTNGKPVVYTLPICPVNFNVNFSLPAVVFVFYYVGVQQACSTQAKSPAYMFRMVWFLLQYFARKTRKQKQPHVQPWDNYDDPRMLTAGPPWRHKHKTSLSIWTGQHDVTLKTEEVPTLLHWYHWQLCETKTCWSECIVIYL